ncbi:MAG: NusA N-terminal domain-containing protein, partial [Alphaproteobacteria bacterium]
MSLEFVQIAEAVAREKDIDKEQVLDVMEQAIQMAARRKYGMELNIKATIDRLSGDVNLKKLVEVVKMVMEPISVEEVRAATREGREPEMRPACDSRGYPLKHNP